MATKVVIENAILRGSQDRSVQILARVYSDGGEEFRVIVPEKATGDPLDWLPQFHVRTLGKELFAGEEIVTNGRSRSITQRVEASLKQRKLDADIWNWGEHPDGRFYGAQICLRGHVQRSDGKTDFKRGEHCPSCGDACIDACQQCNAPIRGSGVYESPLDYERPSFCYNCGRPYPWMEDRLQTAKELLNLDDKLSLEEREKLWGLLQCVMTDPKSDMVPTKKSSSRLALAKRRQRPATS
jgi:hypothetical protein